VHPDRLAVPTPVGASVHNLMRMAKAAGLGDLDPTVVVTVYETAMRHEIRNGNTAPAAPGSDR
jgi:hypothetical protein